ncbi:MAG: hypothetical protein KDD58_00115 [Bdellovibrionales bacterium]|nr:hypothetical protein [Bdellovibrionales bacterium]
MNFRVLILLSLVVLAFQNCNFLGSFDTQDIFSAKSGGGEYYDGKPDPGTYIHEITQLACGGQHSENQIQAITIDENYQITLENQTLYNCSKSQKNISLEDLTYYPNIEGYFIYDGYIFKRKELLRPQWVTELWCRSDSESYLNLFLEYSPSQEQAEFIFPNSKEPARRQLNGTLLTTESSNWQLQAQLDTEIFLGTGKYSATLKNKINQETKNIYCYAGATTLPKITNKVISQTTDLTGLTLLENKSINNIELNNNYLPVKTNKRFQLSHGTHYLFTKDDNKNSSYIKGKVIQLSNGKIYDINFNAGEDWTFKDLYWFGIEEKSIIALFIKESNTESIYEISYNVPIKFVLFDIKENEIIKSDETTSKAITEQQANPFPDSNIPISQVNLNIAFDGRSLYWVNIDALNKKINYNSLDSNFTISTKDRTLQGKMNVVRNIIPFSHENISTKSILWEECKFNYSPILRGENGLPLQSFEICSNKQVIYHQHGKELIELTDWYQEEVQATHFYYLNEDLIIYDYLYPDNEDLSSKLSLNLFNAKTRHVKNITKEIEDYNGLSYTQLVENSDKALLFLTKSGSTGIFSLDLNNFEIHFKKSFSISLYSKYKSSAKNGLFYNSHATDYSEEYKIGSHFINFLDLNTFNVFPEFYNYGGYYSYQKSLSYSVWWGDYLTAFFNDDLNNHSYFIRKSDRRSGQNFEINDTTFSLLKISQSEREKAPTVEVTIENKALMAYLGEQRILKADGYQENGSQQTSAFTDLTLHDVKTGKSFDLIKELNLSVFEKIVLIFPVKNDHICLVLTEVAVQNDSGITKEYKLHAVNIERL